MTLTEAIKRYTNNAEYERTHGNLQGCLEFKKLAEWLKELKYLREQTRWIPVSKRLPKSSGVYLVSVVDGSGEADDYEDVEVAWFAHKKDYNIEESEWRELGIDEVVIAWKPYPQPYKVKSEDVNE